MKKNCAIFCCMISMMALAQQDESWFAFKPGINHKASAINMRHWVDKPAGKHSFLKYVGKDFVFEDGTRTKCWA